ncbi:DUF4873 domain-containing protein [Gordonia hydrophobica]|uniref:DUF4873 domain-containing protein n=1 Tax=Gordonia hydrophobica TaxID=40516 RepID=A0ABZ2U291_9ACTN|nr:DUF4873 domain-containing protein [Gordonia hydrophobica]MBM7366892.1 hypothetical protein [Gordonia hydrophobica]
MTTIALVGTSSTIERVRRLLDDSPLPFRLVDDAGLADLVVTDEAAPVPNHLGVAAADAPNRFFCNDATVDYIVAALTEAHLADARGVRVRRTVQDDPEAPVLGLESSWQRLARRMLRRGTRFDPVDYDWLTDESIDVESFDDDVTVSAGDEAFTARLRARGVVDGNDGRFHWVGMLYSDRAAERKHGGTTSVTVTVADGDPVPAKFAEVTPWGTVRMTGVGAPPW